MLLRSVQTPRGEILNVSEQEARDVFGASEQAIADARKATALIALRAERDQRLRACDWTQVQDAVLSADLKAAWAKYRQALRDLPDISTDPVQPVWPQQPA
ncbi:phage tail assembly chaperone [Chromobacterium phragmitis]|uniref:tail fiber assembly protein n=1 Tax=Chromobacterium amazonense TaxID=1382803 RepID=UPI0021B72094|nr:tail fiber assembly protein [Chromobacterium amazonense]MBM2885663.1 phage tail assembly chaperone [Chromobacterium amazonense]MDE1716014.1 tail fiber assembly protein [Chromobacterium amazonense]